MSSKRKSRILVAGACGRRGSKISKFLKNKGFSIYGADKRVGEESGVFSSFFRLNLRHADSVGLMFRIARPEAVVYSAVSSEDWKTFSAYINTLINAKKQGVEKIVVVVDQAEEKKPETLSEVCQTAIILATKVLAEDEFEYRIISPDDNLLKEIKSFLVNT